MRSGDFSITVRRDDSSVVVTPHGELDIATVGQLRTELERQDAPRLVLDLRGLAFMDSSGMALVVEQQRRAQEQQIDFRLVPGTGIVQRLFETTGTESRLNWIEAGAIMADGPTPGGDRSPQAPDGDGIAETPHSSL